MIFILPSLLLIFLFFVLLVAFFIIFLQVEMVRLAFRKLGIPPTLAFLILILSLVGSTINIPLCTREIHGCAIGNEMSAFFNSWNIPQTTDKQVIAINVGGAVIPVLLCLFLLPRTPLIPTIFATLISTIVCHALARVVPGMGVVLPAFIPPVVAVGLAFIFSPRNKIPVAYIAGVLGVLIGADLMNLPHLGNHPGIMSIGGAGVYDGIFLVGIISALLA